MRKEGFIDIEEMLKESGINTSTNESIYNSNKVKCLKTSASSFLIFPYKNEDYYYKVSEFFYPYSEIIVSELLKDFNINHVEYDLAYLKDTKGLLSKNFKKKDAKYIPGYRLLEDYTGETDIYMLEEYNDLENIWMAVHDRYKDEHITRKLVNQIVDLYIYDILVCNSDRHSFNFEIEEYNGDVNLAPIYDNERFLLSEYISLNVDNNRKTVYDSVDYFIKTSSSEYFDKIKDKLWIISDENILKAYNNIENRTGCIIPSEIKEGYLEKFRIHREKLEKIINDYIRMR